ncbi:dermonecrotic toxin domain-containing protein [Burkholderia pyrrocinia]
MEIRSGLSSTTAAADSNHERDPVNPSPPLPVPVAANESSEGTSTKTEGQLIDSAAAEKSRTKRDATAPDQSRSTQEILADRQDGHTTSARAVSKASDMPSLVADTIAQLERENRISLERVKNMPTLQEIAKAEFSAELDRQFHHQEMDPDKIFVNVFEDNDVEPVDGANTNAPARKMTSSTRLTDVLLKSIRDGRAPTYDPTTAGLYVSQQDDYTRKIGGPDASAKLTLTINNALSDIVSTYNQRVDNYWDRPGEHDITFKESFSRQQRWTLVRLATIAEGDQTSIPSNGQAFTAEDKTQVMNLVQHPRLEDRQGNLDMPGAYAISLPDVSGKVGAAEFSGMYVITESQTSAEIDGKNPANVGASLLYTPGRGLEKFSSLSELNAELSNRLMAPKQRSTLLKNVAAQDRDRVARAGNEVDDTVPFLYTPIQGDVFKNRAQSMIDQYKKDMEFVATDRHDSREPSLPEFASRLDQPQATLLHQVDIEPTLVARDRKLYDQARRSSPKWSVDATSIVQRSQRVHANPELDGFARSAGTRLVTPETVAADTLRQWASRSGVSDLDPDKTEVVTLEYQPKSDGSGYQGIVKDRRTLTQAMLSNWRDGNEGLVERVVGGKSFQEAPSIELVDKLDDQGHWYMNNNNTNLTFTGIFRQSDSKTYSASMQLRLLPHDLENLISEQSGAIHGKLQEFWKANECDYRNLSKLSLVKASELQLGENSLSKEGRDLVWRGAGLEPTQRWEDLTNKQIVDQDEPLGGVEVSPLKIYRYTSTDIRVMTDGASGKTLLYIPGNSSPLHEFSNADEMRSWIVEQTKVPMKREALARHFNQADRPDGIFKSGLDTALEGLADYPASHDLPDDRPGFTVSGRWKPKDYIEAGEHINGDIFNDLAKSQRERGLKEADDIPSNTSVRWQEGLDTVNQLANYIWPLALAFPEVDAFLAVNGLVQAGQGIKEAATGHSADEQARGLQRTAFGLFNALPFAVSKLHAEGSAAENIAEREEAAAHSRAPANSGETPAGESGGTTKPSSEIEAVGDEELIPDRGPQTGYQIPRGWRVARPENLADPDRGVFRVRRGQMNGQEYVLMSDGYFYKSDQNSQGRYIYDPNNRSSQIKIKEGQVAEPQGELLGGARDVEVNELSSNYNITSSVKDIETFKNAIRDSTRPVVIFPPSARGDMNAYKYTAFLDEKDRPLTIFEYFSNPPPNSEQAEFNRNLDVIKQHLSLPNGKLQEGRDYIFANQDDKLKIENSIMTDFETSPGRDFIGPTRRSDGKFASDFRSWVLEKRFRHYQTYDNIMSNPDVRSEVHALFMSEIESDSKIKAYLAEKLPSVDDAPDNQRQENKLIIVNINTRAHQGRWNPREYRHTTPSDSSMRDLIDGIYDANNNARGKGKLDIGFVGSKFNEQEIQSWTEYGKTKGVEVHFFNDMVDKNLNRIQQRAALFALSDRYKSTIYLGHQSGVNEDAQILPRTNVYSLSENLGLGQVGISRVEARPQLDNVKANPLGIAERADRFGNFYSLRNTEFLTTEGILAAVQIKLNLKGMNHRSLTDLWTDLPIKAGKSLSDMTDDETVGVLFNMILEDSGKAFGGIRDMDLDNYKNAIGVIVRRTKAEQSNLSPEAKRYFIKAMERELDRHDKYAPIERHDEKLKAHNAGMSPYKLGNKEKSNRQGSSADDDANYLAWLFPDEIDRRQEVLDDNA